jgi:hypothetical protein
MHSKTTVQELVKMSPQDFQVGFTWILLIEVEVLETEIIHIVDLGWIEKCRVLKYALTRHDSVTSSELKSILNVLIVTDTSIDNNRDFQSLLYLFDDIVMTWSNCLLIMFFCSSMDCQE